MILGGIVKQAREVLYILAALFVQILIKLIISWQVAHNLMSSRFITQMTLQDSKKSIHVLDFREEF